MKKVATITVRQDPDEPRLKMQIYRGKLNFYIRIESDDPGIPHFMPMRIKPTNFKDAKEGGEKLLRLTRAVFRAALGKAPDLPEHLKEMEKEMPAFLHYLLTNSFVGQN